MNHLFSIPFTSHINSTDSFRTNIFPANPYIPIAHVFTPFLKTFTEKNNLLRQHVFTPSDIPALLQKETFFEILILNNFVL